MKKMKIISTMFFTYCVLSAAAQGTNQKTSSKQSIPAGQPTNVLPPAKHAPPKQEPKRVDMRVKAPKMKR